MREEKGRARVRKKACEIKDKEIHREREGKRARAKGRTKWWGERLRAIEKER